MTYSTSRAFNDAQNSSKLGARSKVLSPEELDGGDPLDGRAAAPILERGIGACFFGETGHPEGAPIEPKLHGIILADAARVQGIHVGG